MPICIDCGKKLNRFFSNYDVYSEGSVCKECDTKRKLQNIDGLIALMMEGNMNNWEATRSALMKIGKPAVEPLIKMLYGGEEELTRLKAASVLGELKDSRAIESLIGALKNAEQLQTWEALINALAMIGQPAVESLITMLKTENDALSRMKAAWALGKIKDARAVEPLLAAMQDNRHFVNIVGLLLGVDNKKDEMIANAKEMAIWALGEIGDARAIETLYVLSKDYSHASIREAADKALDKIKIKVNKDLSSKQ